MMKFKELFINLKNSDNFDENSRLLQVVLNYLERTKKASKDDLALIKSFVFDQAKRLLEAIPKAANYKAKDDMFAYEDKLLGLLLFIKSKNVSVSDGELDLIKILLDKVDEERVLEGAIDNISQRKTVFKDDAEKIINIAKSTNDEYQKGMFYQGLLHYEDVLRAFNNEAKEAVSTYVASEIERYLNKVNTLSFDELNNLEFAADLCDYFITDKIIELLKQTLTLPYNNVRFYSVKTLLNHKQNVTAEVIYQLANDLSFACLIFDVVKTHNLTYLFPKQLATPEYLAKSDMVHWLVYPTELGKVPDEIECIGNVKIKREIYYIFKYKSNSDNLGDDLKNEWLIGWSSEDGGTFSNFDKLLDYEQKKPEKTLKVIAKKLIR